MNPAHADSFTAALLVSTAVDDVACSGADILPASSEDEQWLGNLY